MVESDLDYAGTVDVIGDSPVSRVSVQSRRAGGRIRRLAPVSVLTILGIVCNATEIGGNDQNACWIILLCHP